MPQYLTKKYLKSFQLRDYLHVVASDRDRNAYEVRATWWICLRKVLNTHMCSCSLRAAPLLQDRRGELSCHDTMMLRSRVGLESWLVEVVCCCLFVHASNKHTTTALGAL